MKHTPEPWSYRGDIVYFPSLGGGFSLSNCPMPETNAKRIVACVNACAGMDDPQAVINRLRGAVIDAACKYQEIEQQRDELLAENKKMRGLLLLALYHHQGSSSQVGQPIRQHFGIGQFDRLTSEQIAIAKAGDL